MTDQIGVIVNSNSHIDYVCQLVSPLEREQRPATDAYAFGAFVAIALPQPPVPAPATNHSRASDPFAADTPCLIGVVYNTLLVNPNFGNLGPRLTSRTEQTVFSPDLIDETAMLVGVLALGWQDDAGPQQGTPRLAAEVSAPVRHLTDEEGPAVPPRRPRPPEPALCGHAPRPQQPAGPRPPVGNHRPLGRPLPPGAGYPAGHARQRSLEVDSAAGRMSPINRSWKSVSRFRQSR